MAISFEYDVFLSHNSKDKPRVLRLAQRLSAAGVRVWFDAWTIKAGDDIYMAIERGLEAARIQLLCLSPAALGSEWVTLERNTVLFRDPGNKGRRFIPLLLDDCVLPDTLRRYKYVDFREDSEAAFAEVLAACGISEIVEVETRPQTGNSPAGNNFPLAVKESRQEEPLAVLERVIPGGGKSWVRTIAVSPDGKSIVAGSHNSLVTVWDIKNGTRLRKLRGHTANVKSVAITPDGKRILSASDDHFIRVWDFNSGKGLATLVGHTKPVRSITALNDNARALSAGLDGTIRLWDLAKYTCIKTIEFGTGNNSEIYCGSIFPNRNQILTGHQDGKLRLLNYETNVQLGVLIGHTDIVYSVQISPNGDWAVSASKDKTVKIWNLVLSTCVGTLEGHNGSLQAVAISSDGRIVASAGFGGRAVWLSDSKTGELLQVVHTYEKEAPISLAFSADDCQLIVGTTRDRIFVFRVASTRPTSDGESTRRYVNAKVVLIGEGTVGKTSLAHRLITDDYVVQDRTHGMNVWRLDLPLPADATLEREALLWDLAGQEDYRLIHQLFLEQTTLAMLLLNPQKEDPFVEAGAWLKALKSAANGRDAKQETRRLLIYSQIDVGGMKLGSAKIDRFVEQNGFAGWLATSAKTGENCSDRVNGGQPSALKQLIAESIPWDTLPWTRTPRLLSALKNAVMAMRDGQDIRLLRFSELAQRLEQALPGEKFSEAEMRTAVALLANHGLALLLKFGDLVLLRPDLINGYAGAVIRAARAHTDEIGCVQEADIYQPDFDFTGVERLTHRPDEELLLRALVQTFLDHALCIAEDTGHGRQLVFPSQYRRDKDTPKDPDIFVSYTFQGEWQTVWATLVVRLWYSQEFGHSELWRNAAEFTSARGDTLGLLIHQVGDGAATISIHFDLGVPDELKLIFIEYVHLHLGRYAYDVVRDRRYQCACGKPITDIDAVRTRLAAKKDFITCQACDERVPLIDFIEQKLKSDPIAQKILAMEKAISQQLDTQALEQILIGHMMAIAGEANQIFRPVTMFDYGIDGEVEFKDGDGKASGKKIYIQLKSGNSYLRTRRGDGNEVFDVKNVRHIEYWIKQPFDVYLVIRQRNKQSNEDTIRWMNVTQYLKDRNDKQSRQIIFSGAKLDMAEIWRVRDRLFPSIQTKS